MYSYKNGYNGRNPNQLFRLVLIYYIYIYSYNSCNSRISKKGASFFFSNSHHYKIMTDFEATAIYQPGNSWAAHPWRHEPDAHPSRTGRLTGSGFGAMSLSLSMAAAQVFMVTKNGWFLMISQRTSTKWDIMGDSFWATPRCDDVHLLAPKHNVHPDVNIHLLATWCPISLGRSSSWSDGKMLREAESHQYYTGNIGNISRNRMIIKNIVVKWTSSWRPCWIPFQQDTWFK